MVLLGCLVVALTVIVWTAFLPALSGFEEGHPSPRTVTASDTVTVLDKEATESLREYVAQLVEPAYTPDSQALPTATGDMLAFFEVSKRLRQELEESEAGVSDNGQTGVGQSQALQEALDELAAAAPETASRTTLEYLLTAGPNVYDLVLNQSVGALRTVYAGQLNPGSLGPALEKLRSVVKALSASEAVSNAVYEIAAGYVRPNQVVDVQQTQARRAAAMEELAPVTVTVRKGEQVIAEGEVISSKHAAILQALGAAEIRSGWKVWLGVFLLMLLEGVVFFRLLHRFNKVTGVNNIMLLAVTALMVGFAVVARLLILHPLSGYLIPVAGIGMVVAIILNARSGFLAVVMLSLNVGLLTDLQMRYALVSVVVGAFAVFLVSKFMQRLALLGAAALVMVLAAFTIFCVELFREAGLGAALGLSAWGLAQGLLCWVLTVFILQIFDTLFNLSTSLRLLELANPAHPLLKKLVQVAPGTYNHSSQMGNLAEAAAEAIGANPLLARVGAYYHDIGKTIRPEYFVENQIYVDNPHDRLSPNLSKLAITAHVRDGEHLAKLYGLPGPVVDIIKQHHGTSVLAYFYHKARESSKDTVDEEDYRYEEEKPRSKEAAIIMLADGTEAAVRAMRNPTRRKIQGVIQEVFKQRIEDGQLDESDLTLADLHKIRESFDTSLRGLVGHRISYPERGEQRQQRSRRGTGTESRGSGTREEPLAASGAVSSRPRIPPSAAVLRARGSSASQGKGSTGVEPSPDSPADAEMTGEVEGNGS